MIKDKGILIKNVYYMLSYAFHMISDPYYQDIEKEEFENIHSLLAAILEKGISQQLKRGLYREYRSQEEDLISLRGKINIQGTIRNKLAKKRRLTCEFDELTENNLLNQVLKTTALLLIRHGRVGKAEKESLKRSLLFFSNVDSLELSSVNWSTIRFIRNNQTYRMLLSICQLISEGMLLTTEDGEVKLASFFKEEEFNRLFEKFILEYYKAEFPHLKASASQIDWAVDDGITTMLPVMQTDVTLSHNDRTLIIDAKYYARSTQYYRDTHKLHSMNLYQIFTYVKNKAQEFEEGTHEVSGLLLYAKTEENYLEDTTFQMSGNKIAVRTLDLSVDFRDVSNQLNAIPQENL